MDWFTADNHFYHKNIIKLCSRPFETLEDMHRALIDNWNNRVNKKDTVWHLGDFCFGGYKGAFEILNQLNGTIRIIPGGHDEWLKTSIESKRIFIMPPLYTQEYKERKLMFVLCHYPLLTWNRSHYGSYHLHGHSHGNLPPRNNALDIGVDCHNYAPINLDEVIEIILKQNFSI